MIHIVLMEPEIPQNTGNVIRTAMATGSVLHLIKPYGFIFDEAHLRRAAMDYLGQADIRQHVSWPDFLEEEQPEELFYLTRYGHKAPDQFDFAAIEKDIYLVFGRESTGIPKAILKANLARCVRLPMVPEARTLNLANTVAVMVYEVLRQQGYPGLSRDEVQKGADFLERYPGDDEAAG